MKLSYRIAAIALGAAAFSACSNHDFSEFAGNADDPASQRKNEYTQDWIDRFGLFDSNHDWTTLMPVEARISAEFGDSVTTRIYNASPDQGGHLIGFARTAGRLGLDLPKDATSVYATLGDDAGEIYAEGEFEVSGGRVIIGSSSARPARSRSAHEVPYFDAMVVCEDLGGIGDYDFNDIVLGLRHVSGTGTLKVFPMAAGGTLAADVAYGKQDPIGEIHDLLRAGASTSTMLNTTTFSDISRFYNVTVPTDFSLSRDWKNLRFTVTDSGEAYVISGPDKKNEAPQMFCVAGDWYWPKEKIGVDEAYEGFTGWTTDMLNHDWAYKYSSLDKVVPWDVSQVAVNWFAGTTSDASDYSARIDGSTVKVKNNQVYTLEPPTTLASMFSGNTRLTALDVYHDHFDTSLASSLASTFSGCTALQALDLSNWDTGNVTTMASMFNNCSAITDINLANFNTENVTSTSYMFQNCSSLESLDISGWDISKVTYSSGMFDGCANLKNVTMNNWLNTSAKSNIQIMLQSLHNTLEKLVMKDCDFTGTTELGRQSGYDYYGLFWKQAALTSLDVTGWKTPDLSTLKQTFIGCSSLETITGINTWDVSNVKSMEMTFKGCSALKSIDLSRWNTGNVSNMSYLFNGCKDLSDVNLAYLNTSNVTDMSGMFSGCSSLETLDISGWDISKIKYSSSMFDGCSNLNKVTMNNWKNSSSNSDLQYMLQWLRGIVKTLVMKDCDFTGTTELGRQSGYDYYGLFWNQTALTSLDVTGWKTPDLSTLKQTFISCSGLETITGINTWDVSNVKSMEMTFKGCSALKSIDLSRWNTGNVSNMSYLFNGCKDLSDVNLAYLNTSNVTDMSGMFSGCSSLETLDISGWDISKVKFSSSMFDGCSNLNKVTMNNWKNSSSNSDLQYMLQWLRGIVKTLVMKECDFTGTTELGRQSGYDYYGLFWNQTALTSLDVTGWKTPDLKTLKQTFINCSGLETITGINKWDVSNVKSMEMTFKGCSALKSIDLSRWNTGNVSNMSYLFNGCKDLSDVNMAYLNTSNVTEMSGMFSGCSSLEILDISGWDISKVKFSSSMFDGCSNLNKVTMNNWKNNSSNSDLQYMLQWLRGIVKTLVMKDCDFTGTTELGRKSGYDYYGLFWNQTALTSLDVTGWKTPDLKTLKETFINCSGLETITGINKWDVSKVTSMEKIFYGCSALKSIDLSRWNTGNVSNMSYVFSGCKNLSDVNMAYLNTSNVTDMSGMFSGCSSLEMLDISGWDISKVEYSYSMFDGCSKLNKLTMNNWKNNSSNSDLQYMLQWLRGIVKTLVMKDCDFTGTTELGRKSGYDYYGLFWNQTALTSIDLTGWKTPDLKTLKQTFIGCSSLKTIIGIDKLNVSNVGSLSDTFNGCSALETLDLSKWNTGKVTTTAGLFRGCSSLTHIDLSGWDLSNVTDFYNMFYGCPSNLTIKCSAATKEILLNKASSAQLPANVQWQ